MKGTHTQTQTAPPVVQMCPEEWGAQAKALMGAVCVCNSDTGMAGIRMSRIRTALDSAQKVAR